MSEELYIFDDSPDSDIMEEFIVRIGIVAAEMLERTNDHVLVHQMLSEVQAQLLESLLEGGFTH